MKRVEGKYVSTRTVYKAVKKYDHQQFDEFCTRIYTSGYEDGKKFSTEKPVKCITAEELLVVINEVKGVGPALAGRIKEAIEEKFGGISDGKETESKGRTGTTA